MIDRVAMIKKSTFLILINGKSAGTGFAISKDGLIATCFHVVQEITSVDDKVQISFAKQIEVQLNDGSKYPATVHPACQTADFIATDIAVLIVKTPNPLVPLNLGSFKDCEEGAPIYTCGFPFGMAKSFVSTGYVSTKDTTPGYLGQGGNRDIAYLDITLNVGNSGGPIVQMGKTLGDDRVIGIADFGLTPMGPALQQLVQRAATFKGSVALMGVNFKDFSVEIGNAFSRTSVGIGGCVAIDYLKPILNSPFGKSPPPPKK